MTRLRERSTVLVLDHDTFGLSSTGVDGRHLGSRWNGPLVASTRPVRFQIRVYVARQDPVGADGAREGARHDLARSGKLQNGGIGTPRSLSRVTVRIIEAQEAVKVDVAQRHEGTPTPRRRFIRA